VAEKIGLEAIQLKYVSTEAALYFALSRAYRLGRDVIESPPVVNGWDRLLYVIESLLLHLRLSVGEEIRLVLQKR
jgi:hypothetical protein